MTSNRSATSRLRPVARPRTTYSRASAPRGCRSEATCDQRRRRPVHAAAPALLHQPHRARRARRHCDRSRLTPASPLMPIYPAASLTTLRAVPDPTRRLRGRRRTSRTRTRCRRQPARLSAVHGFDVSADYRVSRRPRSDEHRRRERAGVGSQAGEPERGSRGRDPAALPVPAVTARSSRSATRDAAGTTACRCKRRTAR